MSPGVPLWVEIPVAALLVLSGLFTLSAAVGLIRLKTFFQRLHPPALVFSFSAWCVTLASTFYFSAHQDKLSLHAWLIIAFLTLTVPVTTILLSRTELFRKRASDAQGGGMPPPLSPIKPPERKPSEGDAG